MIRLTGRAATRLDAALTGTPAGRPPDPASRDLLKVAEALSQLPPAPGPDPAFRAETRARLLALAERRSAEPVAGPSTASRRTRPATPRVGSGRHQLPVGASWNRRLAGAIAVLAVLVAAVGLLTIASRDALPGDGLYAVKRGAERAQVALTFDQADRGFVLLHQAERRLAEVTALLQEPATALGPGRSMPGSPGVPLAADTAPAYASGTASEVIDTLAAMDEQTAAGVALLTDSAVAAADEATLGILPVWAEGQQGLLGALVGDMSAAEQARAEDSLALLQRVGERARSLGGSLPCRCLDEQGPADDLGPVPCTECAGPGTPPSQTTGKPPSTTTPPSTSTPPSTEAPPTTSGSPPTT